jgi:hypothetical protein
VSRTGAPRDLTEGRALNAMPENADARVTQNVDEAFFAALFAEPPGLFVPGGPL